MGVFSDRVASVQDANKRIVSVPEWDNLEFEVRSLTLAARNQIALTTRDKKGNTIVTKYYAALIVAACFDPASGERAFDASDMDMLQSKNGAATDRLAKAAMELSGLSTPDDDDDDEANGGTLEEAIEDAGKASSSTETYASASS